MSEWGDEVLRHKYDPLPEDAPRHKKKAKKKRVRSDHRHEYETVCVDDHTFVHKGDKRVPEMHTARRCKICGRIGDVWFRGNLREPPDGMPLYEVDGWDYLLRHKELPESRRVR